MDLASLYDTLSNDAAETLFRTLDEKRRRQARAIEQAYWWGYYDNQVPLRYLARILEEQEHRFPPLRLAWGQVAVDAIGERLAVYGFRTSTARMVRRSIGPAQQPAQLDGEPEPGALDDELLDVWEANDMSEQSDELHTAALCAGLAFQMVGPPEDGGYWPRISVEYPDQVAVERDPLTRRVIAAIKVYKSDESQATEDRGVLMVPGMNIPMVRTGDRGWRVETQQGAGEWADQLRPLLYLQTSPLVPVAPCVYRPRRGIGHSAIEAVKEAIDAVNQTATNMLAAIEHHAVARRYAIGLSEEDFTDENGKPLNPWKIATGPLWSIPHPTDERGNALSDAPEVEVGQFPASDLRNFHESLRALMIAFAATGRLPSDYTGYISDNPASEAAIRAGQDRLIRTSEKAQGNFNLSHETAQRIVLTALGRNPLSMLRLETVWMNPATPTMAARIDAAVKGLSGGLIDQDQAWEDIGYTPNQQARMRARRQARSAGSLVDQAVENVRRLELPPGAGGAGTGVRERIVIPG